MKVLSLMVGPIMTNCYILCDEEAKVCAVIDPGRRAGADRRHDRLLRLHPHHAPADPRSL